MNLNQGGNISMHQRLALAVALILSTAAPALATNNNSSNAPDVTVDAKGGSATATGGNATATGGKADASAISGASAIAGGGTGGAATAVQSYEGSQATTQSNAQQYEGYQGYTGQQNLNIRTDIPRQAPPAIAPNMAIGSLSCKSSAVIGLSSPFGGISGGIPMTDEVCERSVLSIRLQELGLHGAAIELLMQDERVERAVRAAQGRGRTSFAPAPVTVKPVPTAVQGN